MEQGSICLLYTSISGWYDLPTKRVYYTTDGALTYGCLLYTSILGDVKASPEKVEISGPTTQVESIAKVVAEVDVSGLSTDSKLPAELILYDEGGKIIDPTMLKTNLGNEGASVNITLKRTKKECREHPVSYTHLSYLLLNHSCLHYCFSNVICTLKFSNASEHPLGRLTSKGTS